MIDLRIVSPPERTGAVLRVLSPVQLTGTAVLAIQRARSMRRHTEHLQNRLDSPPAGDRIIAA
jgi:hypothetical protein